MPDALAPPVLFGLIGYHSASVTTRLLAVKLLGCDRLCQSVSHPSLSHKSLPQALKRSLRSDCPDSSIHRWRGEITGGLGLEPQLRKGRGAIADGGEQVERGVRWSDQKRRGAGRWVGPGLVSSTFSRQESRRRLTRPRTLSQAWFARVSMGVCLSPGHHRLESLSPETVRASGSSLPRMAGRVSPAQAFLGLKCQPEPCLGSLKSALASIQRRAWVSYARVPWMMTHWQMTQMSLMYSGSSGFEFLKWSRSPGCCSRTVLQTNDSQLQQHGFQTKCHDVKKPLVTALYW